MNNKMNLTVNPVSGRNVSGYGCSQRLITLASAVTNGVLMAVVVYTLFWAAIALLPSDVTSMNWNQYSLPLLVAFLLCALAIGYAVFSGIHNTIRCFADEKEGAQLTSRTSLTCSVLSLLVVALLAGHAGISHLPLTMTMIFAALSGLLAAASYRDYQNG